MVKLGHISIDGTKIKANASNNHTITEKEIELIKKLIMKGIDVDIDEDELYGEERRDQLPPGLTAHEKIREVLEELKNTDEKTGKLKKAGINLVEQYVCGGEKEKQEILNKINKMEEKLQKGEQDAVSISDPESRFMKNKKNHTELSILDRTIMTKPEKIHKYTPDSAKKTTMLTVFLAGVITTLGYNSKTDLQKLSEK